MLAMDPFAFCLDPNGLSLDDKLPIFLRFPPYSDITYSLLLLESIAWLFDLSTSLANDC